MATLTPTLTLSSTDIFVDQPLALTVTDALTVSAPMTDISRMNTGDDPYGHGAGIIIADLIQDTHYVYLKHTGILASDGTSTAGTNDYIVVTNADGDHDYVRLYPGEFAFFPLAPADADGDGGIEAGGLKVEAATAVQVNYGFWKRS